MATPRSEYARLGDGFVWRFCRFRSPTISSQIIKLCATLLVLVGFQWLGEQTALMLNINLPGPLLGMLLLLFVLTAVPLDFLDKTSNLLIQNLSLMFVPPSVGAFFLSSKIYQQFPELLAIIVLSTVFAIGFMALLIRRLPSSGGKK